MTLGALCGRMDEAPLLVKELSLGLTHSKTCALYAYKTCALFFIVICILAHASRKALAVTLGYPHWLWSLGYPDPAVSTNTLASLRSFLLPDS